MPMPQAAAMIRRLERERADIASAAGPVLAEIAAAKQELRRRLRATGPARIRVGHMLNDHAATLDALRDDGTLTVADRAEQWQSTLAIVGLHYRTAARWRRDARMASVIDAPTKPGSTLSPGNGDTRTLSESTHNRGIHGGGPANGVAGVIRPEPGTPAAAVPSDDRPSADGRGTDGTPANGTRWPTAGVAPTSEQLPLDFGERLEIAFDELERLRRSVEDRGLDAHTAADTLAGVIHAIRAAMTTHDRS